MDMNNYDNYIYKLVDLEGDGKLGDKVDELQKEGIVLIESGTMLSSLQEYGIKAQEEIFTAYGIKLNEKKEIAYNDLKLSLERDYKLQIEEIWFKVDVKKFFDDSIYKPKREVLHEEVITKIENIKKYLEEIECKDKTLIITDPYLFFKKADEQYIRELNSLLEYSEANKFCFYTPEKQDGKGFLNDEFLNKSEFLVTHQIHDRFWICKESGKGFLVGTSLNGIGKKISVVLDLPEEDINELIEEINKN